MADSRFGSNGGPFGPGRHHPNGSNGVRPHGMDTRPVPFDDIEDPIDLVAVQADDELINALAAGMSVSSPGIGGYDADDRVAAILAAWKADVDADPIPELVDVDTAVAAVVAAARPPSRRARHLAPVAAAAAFIVLAIGGVSVGSYNAQPNDALWPVSKVLYSERAQSVEAAARVEERIALAKQALVAGEPVVAAKELAQASADLASVRPEEGRADLAETQDFLVAKAAETPPGQPADPGAPLVTQPSRQVPSGASSPVRPSPDSTSDRGRWRESGTTGPSNPESSSATRRDPESASTDPRRAAVAPESTNATPTPGPSGNDEGGPSPSSSTSSPPPTGTSEGSRDGSTTTPSGSGTGTAGTPSSSGSSSGSTGATASGDGAPPTSH